MSIAAGIEIAPSAATGVGSLPAASAEMFPAGILASSPASTSTSAQAASFESNWQRMLALLGVREPDSEDDGLDSIPSAAPVGSVASFDAQEHAGDSSKTTAPIALASTLTPAPAAEQAGSAAAALNRSVQAPSGLGARLSQAQDQLAAGASSHHRTHSDSDQLSGPRHAATKRDAAAEAAGSAIPVPLSLAMTAEALSIAASTLTAPSTFPAQHLSTAKAKREEMPTPRAVLAGNSQPTPHLSVPDIKSDSRNDEASSSAQETGADARPISSSPAAPASDAVSTAAGEHGQTGLDRTATGQESVAFASPPSSSSDAGQDQASAAAPGSSQAPPPLPAGEPSAPTAVKHETGEATAHASHPGAASGELRHTAESQAATTAADTGSLARDSAGAPADAITAGASTGVVASGSLSTSMSASSGRETFAAMDSGSGVGAPGWIHAGARQAEAGFQDPSLGWVGIRAGVSGGGIHASLVPGSSDAAQVLSGHVAGLGAHLAEQRAHVETVTVAEPQGWGASSLGANSSSGQGGQNSTYSQSEQGAPTPSPMQPRSEAGTAPQATARASAANPATTALRPEGASISVMA